jgi:hypothetical protein
LCAAPALPQLTLRWIFGNQDYIQRSFNITTERDMSPARNHPVARDLQGYLVAYVSEALGERDICIYGDPEGLRSLGKALIAIADLDQKSLSDTECPGDDSFHQHYKTGIGLSIPSLPRLTIGRVDEKGTGAVRDYFPAPAGR